MKPSPLAATLIEHQRRMVLEKLAGDARLRIEREETLYEFIPRVSRQFKAPHHLDPIVRLLERALAGGVESCSSTPPRHAKTATIVHWMVQTAKSRPNTKLGYVTYNQRRAESVSTTARSIATRAGIQLERDSMGEWRLENGSKILWGGIGASWTGEGLHLAVVDDPFKNREEAESPIVRDKVYESFKDDIYTREEPGELRTSFIVNHTRWHVDDLIGRLIKHHGWDFLNLPAISDRGEALWPSGFDLEFLRRKEATMGPYSFQSLYQGQPIAKGAEVFGEPTLFDALPEGIGYATAIGADFAYSAKSWSDFSVALAIRRYTNGISYVIEVLRVRCEMPEFRAQLRAMADRHPDAQICAFVSTTEKGVAQLIGEGERAKRVHVEPLPATADKFMRAQSVAAEWNAGKLQLPRNMGAIAALGEANAATARVKPDAPVPWIPAFLDEVRSFTGVKDAHDDQVDALAGAFEPFRGMAEDGWDDDDDEGGEGETLTRYGSGRGY